MKPGAKSTQSPFTKVVGGNLTGQTTISSKPVITLKKNSIKQNENISKTLKSSQLTEAGAHSTTHSATASNRFEESTPSEEGKTEGIPLEKSDIMVKLSNRQIEIQ